MCVCVFQSAAPVTEGGRVTQTENTGGVSEKVKGRQRCDTSVCSGEFFLKIMNVCVRN